VLEQKLQTMFSARRAVLVGRAALGLSSVLGCWRERVGECKVALPSAVCHDVLLAVLAAGCTPAFCDVDVNTGLVDGVEWKKSRSSGANVAIVVHLYGNPANTSEVMSIFSTPECLVIDDAAQALGSRLDSSLCGAVGHIGLLSFGATKQISLGNAAMLFQDPDFGAEIAGRLARIRSASDSERQALTTAFRARLEHARRGLREEGARAATRFSGLLGGLQPTLHVPYAVQLEAQIVAALDRYPSSAAARRAKANSWRDSLSGTGLVPVGMGEGCVPWRYACRLPGIGWSTQHSLSERMRAAGMHVSNWYLPAHWFMGEPAGSYPGVETLAEQVFQFWIDDDTTEQTIKDCASLVRQVIATP